MQQYSVSAILPFRDHEEVIGTAVARVARHLRERNIDFELLAVDADSRDNSAALLSLIRPQHPELQLLAAPPRLAHEHAVREARGRVLWLSTPDLLDPSLEAFDDAYARITKGACDLLVARERIALGYRRQLVEIFRGMRTHGDKLPRSLVGRARRRGLRVEERPSRHERSDKRDWFQPLIAAFSFNRTA